MKKILKKSLLGFVIIIFFFNLLAVSNAHSAVGAISKIITKIGKVFSKTSKGVGSGIKGTDSGIDEITKRLMKNP